MQTQSYCLLKHYTWNHEPAVSPNECWSDGKYAWVYSFSMLTSNLQLLSTFYQKIKSFSRNGVYESFLNYMQKSFGFKRTMMLLISEHTHWQIESYIQVWVLMSHVVEWTPSAGRTDFTYFNFEYVNIQSWHHLTYCVKLDELQTLI